MERFENLEGGWTLREHDGHVFLRGPIDYNGLRKYVYEPYRVWERLVHDQICPYCGYVWQPRDPSKPPVSCAACKYYFGPRREPVPDPGAGHRWENVANYLDFTH